MTPDYRAYEQTALNAVCKIKSESDSCTGFFVKPSRLVTCAHFFDEMTDEDVFHVQCSNGNTFTISKGKVFLVEIDDVSIVDLPSNGSEYFELSEQSPDIGSDYVAIGLANTSGELESVRLKYNGRVTGSNPRSKYGEGLVDYSMSGAPVLDYSTGKVVGMLVRSSSTQFAAGGEALPTSILKRAIGSRDFGPSAALRATDSDFGSGNLRTRITSLLEYEHAKVATRRVPGSMSTTYQDLLENPDLLMTFKAMDFVGNRISLAFPEHRGKQSADGSIEPSESHRYSSHLVLSPPGAGKTTWSIALFERMREEFFEGTSDDFPILIDLRSFRSARNAVGFATVEWTRKLISRTIGVPIDDVNSQFEVRIGIESYRARLIVDSVDEFFAAMDATVVAELARRPLFDSAHFLFCRVGFYQKNLSGESFASAAVYSIETYGKPEVLTYAKAYLRLLTDKSGVDAAIMLIADPRLPKLIESTAATPIRLNMILDAIASDRALLDAEEFDLVSVYEGFVDGLLRREHSRPGSTQGPSEKREQLELLAYEFYDDNHGTQEAAPDFSYDAIVECLHENGKMDRTAAEYAASDLREYSLFEEAYDVSRSESLVSLRFSHKSVQEYLLASYLFRGLLEPTRCASHRFRKHLSPDTSEFLKNLFHTVDERRCRRLTDNSTEAFEEIDRTSNNSGGLDCRSRIAKQALGYYVSTMPHEYCREMIRKRILEENDLWCRRGMTIGLAISGDDMELDKYADALFSERKLNLPGTLNKVNTGFNLTFFGDQSFDLSAPEIDQGLPHCRRTVEQLIYQMRTSIDKGCWRIDLVSVLDFWKHRNSSANEFLTVALENLVLLKEVYSSLMGDPRSRNWPELGILANLIQALEENILDGPRENGGSHDPI